MSRWFAARAPKNDSATLNLRNVYIFFSREGMLFAVLLVITFIAGINYGNNLVLGLYNSQSLLARHSTKNATPISSPKAVL